jgi:hypothetical protein
MTNLHANQQRRARRVVARFLFTIGCLAVVGCNNGPKRVDVSGDVTFDGKPLPAGRIFFNPDFTKGNDGPQGYAEIKNGKYNTRTNGKGACGGATVVKIEGYQAGAGDKPGFVGPKLFNEYETKLDLPLETCNRNFDVPASAAANLKKGAKESGR